MLQVSYGKNLLIPPGTSLRRLCIIPKRGWYREESQLWAIQMLNFWCHSVLARRPFCLIVPSSDFSYTLTMHHLYILLIYTLWYNAAKSVGSISDIFCIKYWFYAYYYLYHEGGMGYGIYTMTPVNHGRGIWDPRKGYMGSYTPSNRGFWFA